MLTNIHHLITYHTNDCLGCARTLSKTVSETTTLHWTTQFQSLGVGLGALLAGIGGLKIANDWLNQARLKRMISELRQKYPASSLNKENGYRLVKMEARDEWWLIDERVNKRHWVRNPDTVKELGWRGETPEKIEKAELEGYTKGETIDTTKI